MSHLSIVSCHKIIFCSELQEQILMQGPFADFVQYLPNAFVTIPNGANPRRWIHNANRELSKLITDEIGDENEWLTKGELLTYLKGYTEDMEFFDKFIKIRGRNKRRLLNWLKTKKPIEDIPEGKEHEYMFDIIVKRIDENKR